MPFRPTGEKPVYCSSCFEKIGNSSNNSRNYQDRGDNRGRDFSPSRSYEPRNFGGSPNKDQLAAIGVKLDKIIALLTLKTQNVTLSDEKPQVKPKKVKRAKKEGTILG